MRFPVKIKYRGQVRARIYTNEDGYRLYWRATVAGKRRSLMKSFRTYSEAKTAGDKLAKQLHEGAPATALTASQASDALAALQHLEAFRQSTGKRLSLLESVSGYCAAITKAGTHSLSEAVEGYLSTVATVKRMDIKQAVERFIESRRLKTVPRAAGKRPELSPEHHYNTSLWLREFAATFPGHAVCDLTKAHLDKYMEARAAVGPKTRNERRGVVKMFLQWCVEKDYLAPTHRLFEAGGLKHEPADLGEIEFYTTEELRALLERASKQPGPTKAGKEPEEDYRDLLPVLALAGLAGMRFKEITRLVWEDVLGRPDHIEVKAAKSKTRSRRLIPTCPALAAWLEPYRGRTGPVWTKGYDMLHEDFAALRESLGMPNRHNGLRHAFVSAHFAAYSDENLTAAQAGTSPQMIHAHYKGLLTKAEGEAWFAVSPAQPANVIQLGSQPKRQAC
jgi:integrase